MSTRAVVAAVYETTCDRCAKVRPDGMDGADWWKVDLRQNGAPFRPAWDLCPNCFYVVRQQIEEVQRGV